MAPMVMIPSIPRLRCPRARTGVRPGSRKSAASRSLASPPRSWPGAGCRALRSSPQPAAGDQSGQEHGQERERHDEVGDIAGHRSRAAHAVGADEHRSNEDCGGNRPPGVGAAPASQPRSRCNRSRVTGPGSDSLQAGHLASPGEAGKGARDHAGANEHRRHGHAGIGGGAGIVADRLRLEAPHRAVDEPDQDRGGERDSRPACTRVRAIRRGKLASAMIGADCGQPMLIGSCIGPSIGARRVEGRQNSATAWSRLRRRRAGP